jgi:hypothetical protein
VSGFDGSLIGGRTRLRGKLRFHLGLFASLRLFDCADVGGNAALRTHLRLALHFGALQREPGGIAIRLGACGSLCGTGGLRGLARTRRNKGSSFSFRRSFYIKTPSGLQL